MYRRKEINRCDEKEDLINVDIYINERILNGWKMMKVIIKYLR
jgi:hypothetical protein